MDNTTRVLTILIIVAAFAVTVIAMQWARRRTSAFPLRVIPGYETLPTLVGASIEQGRPMIVAINGDGIGGALTPFALASAEIAYQVARRSAVGGETPIVAVSEPTMIPLAQGTLQRAFASRGRLEQLNNSGVQWYAPGPRSLAFAAMTTALIGSQRGAGGVLAGGFGAEIALPLWGASNLRAPTIAAPHDIEGQAVAYVMADRALLGDEFSLAGAYLGDDPVQVGAVLAQTALRVGVIVALLIPAVIVIGDALTSGAISRALASLFGGG